jgi:hypothetical protein
MGRWVSVAFVLGLLTVVACGKKAPVDGEFRGNCPAKLNYFLPSSDKLGVNDADVGCGVKITRSGDEAEVIFMADSTEGKIVCKGKAKVGSGEMLIVMEPVCEGNAAGEQCKLAMKPLNVKLELGPDGPISATPTFEIWKKDPKQKGCGLEGIAKLEIKPTKLKSAKK